MMDDQKFPAFPYKPYSIQIDFMNALYQSLENGGVSMLESPTGTGKTMSIICSALQWVLDGRQKEKSAASLSYEKGQGKDEQNGSDEEPDWMRDFMIGKDDQPQERGIEERKSRFRAKKNGRGKAFGGFSDTCPRTLEDDNVDLKEEKRTVVNKNSVVESDDIEFLLAEYESEEEGGIGVGKSKRKMRGIYDSSSSDEEDDGEGSEQNVTEPKVYFCSRTHSQLSQFIKELRKTGFTHDIKAVCLGSRKNFCINEDVVGLGNSTYINERCLELQKNKKKEMSKIKDLGQKGRVRRTKGFSGCPMLRKHKLQKEFKDVAFQLGALDIEDALQLGKDMKTCPYYGSRSMVPAADLVVLPYQSLLSRPSRESLGLKLENSIIIIDEAHNLADSLISMYDAKISLSQLEDVESNIKKYLGRFHNLLGAGNRRYIQILMVLAQALLQPIRSDANINCEKTCKDDENPEKPSLDYTMAINDFLFSSNIDNINLVKLLEYIKESHIVRKVSGYGDRVAGLEKHQSTDKSGKSSEKESTLSSFQAFVDILLALTNNDGDGRIIVSKMRSTDSGQQGGFLKYVMLTGEKIFREIVEQAHAVILAGGTLQPIEETRERLFPWLPSDNLHFFSCGHIVPPESILPIAVARGPSGHSFDFSYGSRCSSSMIEELGLLICNLVTVVPEGIVVFFSSFEYESQVYDVWRISGILDRIMKKKFVFREPRRNTEVENILSKYKEAIEKRSTGTHRDPTQPNGAILLAVVGGKISEGINFSDGMGRCIVMVGLPYSSPSNIELLERMKHIEGLGDSHDAKPSKLVNSDECYTGNIRAGFDVLRLCKRRGREYYENLCMKAVNQSIGRAIRHVNDYAAILLVDARYAQDSSKRSVSHPTNKLPQWIRDRLVSSTSGYGEVHRQLHQFFRYNKNKFQ